jgi:hypothetical protein
MDSAGGKCVVFQLRRAQSQAARNPFVRQVADRERSSKSLEKSHKITYRTSTTGQGKTAPEETCRSTESASEVHMSERHGNPDREPPARSARDNLEQVGLILQRLDLVKAETALLRTETREILARLAA